MRDRDDSHRAALSCYTYHQLNGSISDGACIGSLAAAPRATSRSWSTSRASRGAKRTVVRVRQKHAACPPTLTPRQIDRICDACASWGGRVGSWRGSVRDRLLWSMLAESGLRLGEALGLRHRDWHTRTRRHPVHRGRLPRESAYDPCQERVPAPVRFGRARPALRRVRVAVVRGRCGPGHRRFRRLLCLRQSPARAAVRAV